MLNIPTDLLRTLVAVTEMRSFTKAAQSLGVTQPAVSAQIKRLQYLLGYEVLDKSAPGVSLTPRGEIVVNNARRLLSINDEILQLTSGTIPGQAIRVGIPIDYAGSRLPGTLMPVSRAMARHQLQCQQRRRSTRCCAISSRPSSTSCWRCLPRSRPSRRATYGRRRSVWVHSDATRLDPDGPVPLVSYGGDSACQRIAVAALHRAGLDCNFVFTSHSQVSLLAAVAAGFGVMAVPRGRAIRNNLSIWEDAPLPKLPELLLRDLGPRRRRPDRDRGACRLSQGRNHGRAASRLFESTLRMVAGPVPGQLAEDGAGAQLSLRSAAAGRNAGSKISPAFGLARNP